jgi:hypothetical protein
MIQPLNTKEPPNIQEKPRTPFKDEKIEKPPEPQSPSETIHKQFPKTDDKPPISPIFEKALSSAIEKRQTYPAKDNKAKKQEPESNQ